MLDTGTGSAVLRHVAVTVGDVNGLRLTSSGPRILHAMLIHATPGVSGSIRLTSQNAVPSMCHHCCDRDTERERESRGGETGRECGATAGHII